VLSANVGATDSRSPSISQQNRRKTTFSRGITWDAGVGVSQTLPYGTAFGLDLTGQWIKRRSATASQEPAVIIPSWFGPTWSGTAQLWVSQPFLRGAGLDIGQASLRVARLNRTAAVLDAQQTASQLLQDALVDYWELWYKDESVRISEATRDTAREQEKQALQQVASGAIAQSEALSYQTRHAEQKEAVVAATTDRLASAITLATALGQPERGGPDLRASGPLPAEVEPTPSAARAIDEALSNSFDLKQLEVQMALATDQARIAGDSLRPRLNAEGYVQAQGLGYREVPPVFDQIGKLQGFGAHVGLTFEMPLSDARREAQIQNAKLAVHVGAKQIEATRQQIRGQIMTSIANREAALKKLKYAQETERIARQQTEAEKARFAAGASVALLVRQAEDSWAQAQLRLQRAKVDLVEADVKLLHLRGRLLDRYTNVLDRLRPNTYGLPADVGWGPW
jgi:outer membrane protein TolC